MLATHLLFVLTILNGRDLTDTRVIEGDKHGGRSASSAGCPGVAFGSDNDEGIGEIPARLGAVKSRNCKSM